MGQEGIAPVNDRFASTMFMAALFHGIVIVGVTFSIPDPPPDDASITERMTAQFARAAYWLLAVLTGIASLGALMLTYRLLAIWNSENGA